MYDPDPDSSAPQDKARQDSVMSWSKLARPKTSVQANPQDKYGETPRGSSAVPDGYLRQDSRPDLDDSSRMLSEAKVQAVINLSEEDEEKEEDAPEEEKRENRTDSEEVS